MSKMNNNRYRRNYEKPQWEVEKERLEQEKAEKDARNMEQTEENFPSLVTTRPTMTTWSGRKFSELASEWKADADERKVLQDSNKTSGGSTSHATDGFVMPTFKLSHHYVESEETAVSNDEHIVKKEEDEWVTVDHGAKHRARLIRKQQRFEEKMRRMDAGEESESEPDDINDDQVDDSCWNDAPIGKSFNS